MSSRWRPARRRRSASRTTSNCPSARGGEAPHIFRELTGWTARHQALESEVGAEGRRLPEVLELGLWIEEYRVSLYAQELKTVGAVSAARLARFATHGQDVQRRGRASPGQPSGTGQISLHPSLSPPYWVLTQWRRLRLG